MNEKTKTATDESPYILVSSHKDGSQEIHIHNLCVKTPGENGATLVRDVNLTLKKGQRVVFTGASGTGKTTVAKSILSHWDHGFGHITMPENIKIMGLAQKPYFPNVSLREILNNAPEAHCTLDDRDLVKALHTVDLAKLVQHIPGQQIALIMDDLLPFMEKEIEPYTNLEMTDSVLDDIREKTNTKLKRLIKAQFSTVQFVPPAQRKEFRQKINDLFQTIIKTMPSENSLRGFSDSLIDAMDIALAKPLKNLLIRETINQGEKINPFIFPYTEKDIEYAVKKFTKKTQARFDSYIRNEDTDDQLREIRINQAQVNHILAALSKTLKDTLVKNNSSKTQDFFDTPYIPGLNKIFARAAGSTAGKMLEKAAFIPKRISLSGSLDDMTDSLIQKTAYFLEKQNLKGRELTTGTYLSDGQKQRLMIAIALLHKTDVLILDEITASLNEEMGEKLYKELMDSIPEDTIVLSIAHNSYLAKYHTHRAHLENQAVTMEEIKKIPESAQKPCAACPFSPAKP